MQICEETVGCKFKPNEFEEEGKSLLRSINGQLRTLLLQGAISSLPELLL